jgi:acyl-CoA synthetase (AMP-forming)/AMP-acid ligase II
MTHDVIDMIHQAAEKFPSKIALSQGSEFYTYAELSESISSIVTNLHREGMVPGDRLFFSVRPDPDGILLALGVVAAGGVLVFADSGTAPEIFNARIDLCKPRFAAAESLLYLASTKFMAPIVRKKGITMPDYRAIPVEQHFYSGPKLPGTPRGAISVKKLRRTPVSPSPLITDPSAESIIVFTSGTTANPKCVRHSRNSIGSGMFSFIEKCGIDQDSYVYTDHFNFGVTAMITGGRWDIPEHPPAKDARKWVGGLLNRRVTHTFLVPADATLMLNELEQCGVDSDSLHLENLAMGAAPVLPALIKRINRIMPKTRVLSVYGMTEILPIAIVDGAEKIDYPEGDLAGKIQNGVTARIDTSNNASENDTSGELILSGPGLMLGYLGQEPTNEHRTGDHARFDDTGNLVLLGRIKDMLIRANKNIYPGLYESSISAIDGVRSCAIVGVPDKYGEDIVVLAVVKEDEGQNEKDFRKAIAPGLISAIDGDAQPDVILVLNEIPLSGRSSKPDRNELRRLVTKTHEVHTLLKAHDRG